MICERLPTWVEARLAFDAWGTRWHLVLEGGNVTALGLGEIANPDVTLRWDRDDALAILEYSLQGNDALAVTTVVTRDYLGPPAPLNLAVRPELSALPRVPGASFTAQYVFREGPFGDVFYALTFDEGRLVAERLEIIEQRDVLVEVSYRAMALVRAGEITIIDALQGGNVAGELGPLGLLAGISESGAFHEAELATGRHAIPLAALGQVWRQPAIMRRMRELAFGESGRSISASMP